MTTSSTSPRSFADPERVLAGASVRWTGRADGDLASPRDPAERSAVSRLAGLGDRRVAWLHQVHGGHVVVVSGGDGGRGEDGDALVTTGDTALAVMTADCAPVALSSAEGVVAAVHAGWRGLAEGVIATAVATMRAKGASHIEAALGPCIHAECYAFGAAELDVVSSRLGSTVRAQLPDGRPALDLPAAVGAALGDAGAPLVHDADVCTACAADAAFAPSYFSWRARGESQRQAMIVWKA